MFWRILDENLGYFANISSEEIDFEVWNSEKSSVFRRSRIDQSPDQKKAHLKRWPCYGVLDLGKLSLKKATLGKFSLRMSIKTSISFILAKNSNLTFYWNVLLTPTFRRNKHEFSCDNKGHVIVTIGEYSAGGPEGIWRHGVSLFWGPKNPLNWVDNVSHTPLGVTLRKWVYSTEIPGITLLFLFH